MSAQHKEIVVPTEPKTAAAAVGLRYVCDNRPGIRRKRGGKGFSYTRPDGSRLTDPATLKRLRGLAVPPAWRQVWLCPFADGHLQATGRDDRGRKQYRYHARFREIRDSTKFEHVVGFAEALPALRNKVREHMRLPGLPRDKVLATVVYLLDKTLIRVGNNDYARHNKSYGLTTLKNRHAEVDGSEVRFHFVGKGGKEWSAKLRDRRIARIIRACQELPGQELLQYRDDDGTIQDVTSSNVNDYLRQISGKDVTAKDFRTWAGTVLAAAALTQSEAHGDGPKLKPKKRLNAAIASVAARLGNTPAICRKCYVHPEVLTAYGEGSLERDFAMQMNKARRRKGAGLEPVEAAVLGWLGSRVKATGNGAALGSAERVRRQLRGSVALLRSRKAPRAASKQGPTHEMRHLRPCA